MSYEKVREATKRHERHEEHKESGSSLFYILKGNHQALHFRYFQEKLPRHFNFTYKSRSILPSNFVEHSNTCAKR